MNTFCRLAFVAFAIGFAASPAYATPRHYSSPAQCGNCQGNYSLEVGNYGGKHHGKYGGKHGAKGAPDPIAGAGLPFLGAAYLIIRHRRRKAAENRSR